MNSQVKNIARKGSGAYLNATLYNEWRAKVKRHDKLEDALKRISEIHECWGFERKDGKQYDANPAEIASAALANSRNLPRDENAQD